MILHKNHQKIYKILCKFQDVGTKIFSSIENSYSFR